MPWWSSYFDERYLDVFGDSFTEEHTAREAAAIADFLDLPRGAKVLDLACGQGRHAIALAQRGYAVTGLDLSSIPYGFAANISTATHSPCASLTA